jgi:hypothetical protein
VEKVEYWFNTETGEVEMGKQTLASNRLGPFESEAEARRALEIIQVRAAAIREEDDAEDWS